MYDPKIHHRRSIRLRGHDYGGGGAYFITTCVQTREFLLGQVVETEMELTEAGRTVEEIWRSLKARFPQVVLDAFRVMPSHLHGIIVIPGPGLEPSLATATGAPVIQPVGQGLAPANVTRKSNQAGRSPAIAPNISNQAGASPGPTLGAVVGAFKSISASTVNHALLRAGRLWQEDYFECVIRDVDELMAIRDYIIHNPERWLEDPENPDHL